MNRKQIKFAKELDYILSPNYITYSKNIEELFFLKNDKLFIWCINNNNIEELSEELNFICHKIFYRQKNNILLIVGDDGLYSFNIGNKQIYNLFEFTYDYDFHYSYIEEIDKFIIITSYDFRVIFFDIESSNVNIYNGKIMYEPVKVKYYDNKLFFILKSNTFESTIKVYSQDLQSLENEFTYKDYIYDLIYLKSDKQIIFQYVSAERKPSFFDVYDLENSEIINIQNTNNINIFSIADYNKEYFISYSNNLNKKITFFKKDFSYSFSCDGVIKGDICLFDNKNNFKSFLTYNNNDRCIYLWELI